MTEADPTPGVYVALGSNLPHEGLEGPALLRAAVEALGRAGLAVSRVSSIWETAPWPAADQANFFNAVVEVDAGAHTPETLFQQMCAIERAFGRERRERWGARTLDLDLIDFRGLSGSFGLVTLPHPRAHERAFVLAPLAELGWRHPVLGSSAADLLAALPPGQVATKRPEPLVGNGPLP